MLDIERRNIERGKREKMEDRKNLGNVKEKERKGWKVTGERGTKRQRKRTRKK